ncbi:formate dehydrogenase accessory sulfurtransferase FdhD [Brevundimonas sp.]|uniref:formate dehydrogenase accessory sulfurtransferase FdhD n=1 Tax=Brevundimonas sp. TaxID=1871086 RepID=UPI00289ABAF2|nr:formate dehydrogenase accessory sulfurtransferase FdhD [Brevundimonas sp.]
MASRDEEHEPRTPPPIRDAARTRWTVHGVEPGQRRAPEETAVALVHDASTTAVMMATPADLEDFAVGFSLSEGAIARVEDIRDLDVVVQDLGVEVRMWLAPERALHVASRRRRLAGPTGCGLCGIDSLAEAVRSPRRVAGETVRVEPAALLAAMSALSDAQPLGRETRAMHAAGFWTPTSGLLAVREDVGRHNALDKLIGARARAGAAGAAAGVVLLTSRVSVEMVQKAAVLGAPILCAVSAPTALAIRVAEEAGITLVAVARADGFEVFSHRERVLA